MREVAPWGLVFVPVTGEAGGEKGAPGVLGWWSPFPAPTVAKGALLSLLALQEIVLGVRGAERKGQALYYFVFQIENLLLAQFMTSRSPAKHILFPSVGET